MTDEDPIYICYKCMTPFNTVEACEDHMETEHD